MTNGLQIAPTDIRDYAKARGWDLLIEALPDRLYVLEHPQYRNRQLVFPMDTSAPDYEETTMLVAEKLADLEAKPIKVILESLQEVRDDTVRFRISSDRNGGIQSIPLTFASSAITAAQHLLLSAACTVLKPRSHHPRMSLTEAQQLLAAARFRHTEHGSFVLKVSCAIDALDIPSTYSLFSDVLEPFKDVLEPGELQGLVAEPSFVRRTMLTLDRAVRQLVTAIEADRLSELVEQTQHSSFPAVSSNLCEALTLFQDEVLKNSVEMSISWAVLYPVPSATNLVRIQQDYFPRIEEVRRALRPVTEHEEDTFIGTVEQLNGEMGSDGRRAGEVIIAVLLESEVVRARTNLTAENMQMPIELT